MAGWLIKLTGQKELRSLLKNAGRDAPGVLAQALTEEAQLMMRASQKEVPHADGTLMASGVVQPAQITGQGASVTLGYGGAASAYALRQHEDLSLTHPDVTNPKSRASGKAKYLEDPVRARFDNMQANVRKRVARILGTK